jgi:hypothetical protein
MQKRSDQRTEASAQRALREMRTIDRVEIRANDGFPMAPWSLQRTISGGEAEELAARWRRVHFHFIGRFDHSGPRYTPQYQLRFYRGERLIDELNADLERMALNLGGPTYRDCSFKIDWDDRDNRLQLGDLIPVSAARAFAAILAAHWGSHMDADNARTIELFRRAYP